MRNNNIKIITLSHHSCKSNLAEDEVKNILVLLEKRVREKFSTSHLKFSSRNYSSLFQKIYVHVIHIPIRVFAKTN